MQQIFPRDLRQETKWIALTRTIGLGSAAWHNSLVKHHGISARGLGVDKMAAPGNGRVSIRSSRGPSLLVVGLVIASLVLFYGYWSVSSRNSQLLKDVNILQDRLRVLAAQKVAADRKNSALSSQMEQQSRTLKGSLEGERRAREDEKAELNRRVEQLMQGGKDKDDKLARLESQQDRHKNEIAQLNKFVTNSTQSLKLLAGKAAKVIGDHKALNEKYQKTLSIVKTLEREKDECHDALAKAEKAQEASSGKKSDDARKTEKKENERDEGNEQKDEDKNQGSRKDKQKEQEQDQEEESKDGTPSQEELTDNPVSVTKRSAILDDESESKGASNGALSSRLDETSVKRDAKIGDWSDASLPSEKEDDRKRKTSDEENDGEQQEKNDSEEQEGDKRNDSVENKENDSEEKEHSKENDSKEQNDDKENDSEEKEHSKENDSKEQNDDKENDSEEKEHSKENDSEEQDGDKENDSEENESNRENDSKEQDSDKENDSEEKEHNKENNSKKRKNKAEDSPFDSSKVGQQDAFGQGNFEDQEEEEDEGENDMRKSVNIPAQSSWSNTFK